MGRIHDKFLSLNVVPVDEYSLRGINYNSQP